MTHSGETEPNEKVNDVEKRPALSPTLRKDQCKVYRLVLTGGPCGGKTTGMVRVASFFEELGWKVFTVPECATILLGGGVKFSELNETQAYQFQKDVLLTLLRIEEVFFTQASLITNKNVLVICDRGAMDPSAYIDKLGWLKMLDELGLDETYLRDNRYDQIIHMVTAADGAESFYSLANNNTRKEGIEDAKKVDWQTRLAWIGHPSLFLIDNSECASFEDKIRKLLQVVCDRAGVYTYERLAKNSRKRKWLLAGIDETQFPKYEEFQMKHDYLLPDDGNQLRIRSRGQRDKMTYSLTSRNIMEGEAVETRMKLTKREYESYLNMKDRSRTTIHKVRRCFAWGNHFYSLDRFVLPLPPNCPKEGLLMLETYTTFPKGSADPILPPFLQVVREVTKEKEYSMHELSKNK
ncbi:unnamed protein product, partial [Mesorhabditis belari]|uniref:NadR/Ttd14 AAA domain-containing protein n=1 Tax=Mesorhabditis belari TaxID=2138241 RepID=A0AAF3EKH0_9BILA